MARPPIKTHVDWYASARQNYEELASVAAATIRSVMRLHGIDILAVTYRAKELESFKEKIGRKRYRDPRSDMVDLAGVRIVTFIDSDVARAKMALEGTFGVRPDHSGDKLDALGDDRVGYRSIHLVCDLGETRTALPEFEPYRGMVFEVQIRTALQHAWAEIEHDRSYKFKGELPSSLKRRFHLVAGLLELADREFDSLSREILEYAKDVHVQAQAGNLNIELNTASIDEFLKIKLGSLKLLENYEPLAVSEELIDELRSFGCSGLSDLDKLLTPECLDFAASFSSFTTYSLIRDSMILADPERYFRFSWKGRWHGWDRESFEKFREKLGDDLINRLVEETKIDIVPDDSDWGFAEYES